MCPLEEKKTTITLSALTNSYILRVYANYTARENCRLGIRETIYHLIRFAQPKINDQFFMLCDTTFLVRLQGKFEIDHTWEWKGQWLWSNQRSNTSTRFLGNYSCLTLIRYAMRHTWRFAVWFSSSLTCPSPLPAILVHTPALPSGGMALGFFKVAIVLALGHITTNSRQLHGLLPFLLTRSSFLKTTYNSAIRK